ncbi:MAG TPA: YihY/virulence factor BrkB family protein [Streptosporangiaceae bacterium]|jgi:YihY family inner membrane protein
MNAAERLLRRIDAAQQRRTAPAFLIGVIKKYGDDNGGVLAANLAYSSFVSLFPLLLVLTTILGLVVAGNEAIRQDVLHAVAGQFPLIGDQLADVQALRRSSIIGLIVGLATLVWGASGLAQAAQYTMAQVWNVPGPARPGYLQRLGRAGLFLALLGAGVIVTTLLASLSTYGHKAAVIAVLAEIVALAGNIGIYFTGFRVLTPKGVPSGRLWPGAVAGGAAWTVLQAAGTYLVHHFLRGDSVYGVFATVLGLMAWIYLGVQVTVYTAEINVVLARRLWPRALLQPPLTEADRASLAMQALQNQRRPEQHVDVSYDDRPPGTGPGKRTPRTPDEVAPPAKQGDGEGSRGW